MQPTDNFYFQRGERLLLLRLRELFDEGKRGQNKRILIEKSEGHYQLSSLTPQGKIRIDRK